MPFSHFYMQAVPADDVGRMRRTRAVISDERGSTEERAIQDAGHELEAQNEDL